MPCPLLFLVLSTRLRIVYARPLKAKQSKAKVVPTDLNWCVGLVSLLSCALTPLLPRRRAKRDRLHAALRTNESGEEEKQSIGGPKIPKTKRVYMNIQYHTQYAARQGVVSRNRRAQCRSQSCDPLIMSKKDRPEESDRPCVP